jgi:hypothetical protein
MNTITIYCILTEKYKTTRPDLTAPIYWSQIFGCGSMRDKATRFATFEAAQPTLRKLRQHAPDWFFHAIEMREVLV